MKNEDVKIGMKVVPFQKTAGLERFNFVWNRVKAQNQLFLYVVKKHNTSWILNCSKNDKTGDYYNACDFEPYIEKKSITKNIKHIITGNKTIVVIQNEDGTYLKGESKCNPQDKFDEQEGFRVAYSRAIGKEPFEKSVMVQDNEQSNITTNKLQVNEKIWTMLINQKAVINCRTKQEAKQFIQYCKRQGIKWITEENIADNDCDGWGDYNKSVCYCISNNSLAFSSISSLQRWHNFLIIPFNKLFNQNTRLSQCTNEELLEELRIRMEK